MIPEIDKDVLLECRNAITISLGTLDDIPRVLANTIANIYYKFFYFKKALDGNPLTEGLLGTKDDDIFDKLEEFSADCNKVMAYIQVIPGCIESLREIDREKQPNTYSLLVNLFIDAWKYNIDNAPKKSGLRRLIERNFKKVEEIPNLLELLDIRS